MQSYAVADPLINEVIDLVTGRVVPAAKAIGADYDKAIQQRLLLRQANSAGAPLYVCVHCAKPVVTNCMHQERRFYFRHARDTGECTVDIRREDTTGKWAAKIAAHRAAASRRVVTPPEDSEIARFLEFLFPELAQVPAADPPSSA